LLAVAEYFLFHPQRLRKFDKVTQGKSIFNHVRFATKENCLAAGFPNVNKIADNLKMNELEPDRW